jgi:beta-glucosidase
MRNLDEFFWGAASFHSLEPLGSNARSLNSLTVSATGNSRFPTPSQPLSKAFLWGAATSAYQVEGGIKNDWSEAGFDAGKAADHYNLFEKDFDIAKELGHNAHRFSIEWARIEPEQGKFNQKEIEHYRKVIAALRRRGMEPFVTLWHFTNPIWFAKMGGWKNKKSVEYFVRYAKFVVENFKNEIKFWITINEPDVYTLNTCLRNVWPAYGQKIISAEKSPSAGISLLFGPRFLSSWKTIHNLLAAHCAAYEIVKKINPDFQVGIAKNNIHFHKISAPLKKWWWNTYPLSRIKNHQDFIGLNYYFDFHEHKNEKIEVSDLGWKIGPRGLYWVLRDLKKYHKPIYITENGLADAKDEKRAKFIVDHIYWMKKAMPEGVDIRGYFYWSLIDNFEWHRGFWPRFGLIEIDYKTMERKIRPSAYVYKDIIKMNL